MIMMTSSSHAAAAAAAAASLVMPRGLLRCGPVPVDCRTTLTHPIPHSRCLDLRRSGSAAVFTRSRGRCVGCVKGGRWGRVDLLRPVVAAGAGPAGVVAAGLVAAGAIAAAVGAMGSGSRGAREQAIAATRRGMNRFIQGDVLGSMKDFDEALSLDPSQKPYLWQRGLSLYYLDRFGDAAQQFRDDVAVNPNDTEEAIWCFLAEAQIYGVEKARSQFLQVGVDSRPIMRAAHDLFKNGGSTDELLLASGNDKGGHDSFYALLYKSLYHESQRDAEHAKKAMIDAVQTPYGQRSGDYMAKLAAVHCQCRGWSMEETSAESMRL